MDKVIEQIKKLQTQRKTLDGKISALETKLVGAAKAAAKTAVSKTAGARGAARKGKSIAKAVRAKVKL
ncbi:MAG: hypothetical protein LBK74_09040 [Treponema sp.]|jgi:cell division septum initiation protein DivIVA|nr:hypothetical protein [Treponema sp.]